MRGFAMQPNPSGSCLERLHGLGQEPGDYSGEHVAGAGGGQVGRRIRGDGRTAVCGRDDRVWVP